MSSRVIFDSGVVGNNGAAISTNAFPCTNTKALEVLIDTEGSTAMRAFTMFGYQINPQTGLFASIDSGNLGSGLVLRRVGFGVAPAGSQFSPGKVRALVGPYASSGPSGIHTLLDTSSAPGAGINSGPVNVEDQEQVTLYVVSSGGAVGAYVVETRLYFDDDPLSSLIAGSVAVGAGQTSSIHTLGQGMTVLPTNRSGSLSPQVQTRRAEWSVAAGGAGVTHRLVAVGKGRVPGTFAHQVAFAPFVSFQLGSTGVAGNTARMIVVENT